MDNWERAEYELMYRIKQKAHRLEEEGLPMRDALENAKQELRDDIRLRAYLIYCATKDYTMQNWLRAENDILNIHTNDINNYAKMLVSASENWLNFEAAIEIAKFEFIRTSAYYKWLDRCNMENDWYTSEKNLNKTICNLAEKIRLDYLYLTNEEAWFCARDRMYSEIKGRADKRQESIALSAYFKSKRDPCNSDIENWYNAATEYDTEET